MNTERLGPPTAPPDGSITSNVQEIDDIINDAWEPILRMIQQGHCAGWFYPTDGERKRAPSGQRMSTAIWGSTRGTPLISPAVRSDSAVMMPSRLDLESQIAISWVEVKGKRVSRDRIENKLFGHLAIVLSEDQRRGVEWGEYEERKVYEMTLSLLCLVTLEKKERKKEGEEKNVVPELHQVTE